MNWRVSCDHCSYHTGEGGGEGGGRGEEGEGGEGERGGERKGERRGRERGGREGREREGREVIKLPNTRGLVHSHCRVGACRVCT